MLYFQSFHVPCLNELSQLRIKQNQYLRTYAGDRQSGEHSPSAWDTGQPSLHIKFQDSQGYVARRQQQQQQQREPYVNAPDRSLLSFPLLALTIHLPVWELSHTPKRHLARACTVLHQLCPQYRCVSAFPSGFPLPLCRSSILTASASSVLA